MNRLVLATSLMLTAVVAFALASPAQAEHVTGAGCHAAAVAGCAGAHGCHGRARWFPGKLALRTAGRVVVIPARAVQRIRFAPSRRFGCGG